MISRFRKYLRSSSHRADTTDVGSPLLAGIDAAPRGLGGPRALACLLGASLWALPAALGVWGGAVDVELDAPRVGVSGYLALVGCGLLSLVLVASAWGSRARSDWEASWSRVLTMGLGLALGPWAALAYWLAVATHHRPLGAVTFAVAACFVGGVSIALSRWVLRRGPSVRWLVPLGWVICASSVASLVFVLSPAAFQQPVLRSVVPDVALGALLALLVAVMPRAREGRRAARWAVPWAVPTCVCVWVLTLGLLVSSADVRATVKSVPIVAGVAGLILR